MTRNQERQKTEQAEDQPHDENKQSGGAHLHIGNRDDFLIVIDHLVDKDDTAFTCVAAREAVRQRRHTVRTQALATGLAESKRRPIGMIKAVHSGSFMVPRRATGRASILISQKEEFKRD